MKLEDLRRDDIGVIVARIKKESPKNSTPLTFHEYCGTAFYLTCQSIEQLENSKQLINQGNNNVLAVGMWFIAIEAFINALLRIAGRIKNKNFDDYKRQDIGSRLSSLMVILGIAKEQFYKSGIFQRLEEFKTFRNEIFHDRTWESELSFHRTKFSELPFLSNQVDAMQAAIIALEIFYAFRFVYESLDLMPDIVVKKEDSFGYIKLDILYGTILRPYFLAALKKHNLTSDLIDNPALISLEKTDISNKEEIEIIIKAAQNDKYIVPPNELNSAIGAELFSIAQATIRIDAVKDFGSPRY